MAAGGQRCRAVEDADIVEAQKTALEDIEALGILAVDPPIEVEHQFMEGSLEEDAVASTAMLLLDLIDAPGGPSQHRRVDIAEGPLIGGGLAVRMLVPLPQQQVDLALGEIGVH